MRISDWSSDVCSSDLLLLEHLQLARLRHVHAAILGLPRVQRRAADAVLATHIGGLHPAFLLAQHRDDLLLAEPGLPHVRLLTKADSSSNGTKFEHEPPVELSVLGKGTVRIDVMANGTGLHGSLRTRVLDQSFKAVEVAPLYDGWGC